jgi:F-type H+-transporting ATPase subunit alpha
VISITDGQIYLEPDLFYAGVRPAVNVGISVSRVGGNAQTKAMKKVAGKLRLDLAQFREMEAFAQFASDLDAGTKAQLARGQRTVEILKQPTCATWPMEEQVASIFAIGQGLMDDVPLEEVRRFEGEMIAALRAMPSAGLKAIKETGKLEDETAAKLKEEISGFKKSHWKSAVAPPAKEGAAKEPAKPEAAKAEHGKPGTPKAPEAPSKPPEKKPAH